MKRINLFIFATSILVSLSYAKAQNFEYRYPGYHGEEGKYSKISSALVNSESKNLIFLGVDSASFHTGEGSSTNYGKIMVGTLSDSGELLNCQTGSKEYFDGVFPGSLYSNGLQFIYYYQGHFPFYNSVNVVFLDSQLNIEEDVDHQEMAAFYGLRGVGCYNSYYQLAFYLQNDEKWCKIISYGLSGQAISEFDISLIDKKFSTTFIKNKVFVLLNDSNGLKLSCYDINGNLDFSKNISQNQGSGSFLINDSLITVVHTTGGLNKNQAFIISRLELQTDSLSFENIGVYPITSNLEFLKETRDTLYIVIKNQEFASKDSLYEFLQVAKDSKLIQRKFVGLDGGNHLISSSDSLFFICSTQQIDASTVLQLSTYSLSGKLLDNSYKYYNGNLSISELRAQKDGSVTFSGILNDDGWLLWLKRESLNLGFETNNYSKFELAPNPATDYFRIRGLKDHSRVKIFDETGKIFYDQDVIGCTIGTQGWNSGSYLIFEESGKFISKIIILK